MKSRLLTGIGVPIVRGHTLTPFHLVILSPNVARAHSTLNSWKPLSTLPLPRVRRIGINDDEDPTVEGEMILRILFPRLVQMVFKHRPTCRWSLLTYVFYVTTYRKGRSLTLSES